MNRCKLCVMPDTRPDVPFTDGVCQACINYQNRPNVDWAERRKQLERLLEDNKNDSGFDCIVPSSGGKDSHYQVLKLIELGARPLVVTATTCHLTEIGRLNIDNLKRYATTIEVSLNTSIRRILNAEALRLVGDISWPEHVSIFTIPFKIAIAMKIPLIFYGENPQDQYGGPHGTEKARLLTHRWRSEFGGFLGLRPSDFVGTKGITAKDMQDYEMPTGHEMAEAGIQAHFLGQYLPWDSHENAEVAIAAGMRYELPSLANAWSWENLDNAQTGIHDYFMYRKYGYGRGCAQMSVDIRSGMYSREDALPWVDKYDGAYPIRYSDVPLIEVLRRLAISREEFDEVADQFTNWEIFRRVEDDADAEPILI